jgi:hypothetical protein
MECSVQGADTFLMIPGLVTEDDFYADVYARSQQTVKALAPITEEYKVNIGL